ncbi:superkiller protein 3 [Butyriboletus roseoflavus]|nr:superkiller protein 3 [Butyriboletus roseoflavus]
MSSSFAKAKLKTARDALGKKQYDAARDAALQVLDYDPENYNAHVFLGLALLELGEHDKSEQYYRKAIELKPDQILARQGISQLYEKSGRWDAFSEALEHIMRMFSKSGDVTKCAETLQNLISTRREHGTRQQVVSALSYLLPDSSLSVTLSNLPPPDPTNPTASSTFDIQAAVHNSLPIIEEIISIIERDEEVLIKNEFDKRRTRLGGPSPDQLKKDIGVEVWGASRLPSLYQEVLNHPNTSDELRRSTETKLIMYKQIYFYALPTTSSEKAPLGKEVDELVEGVVIIGVPDEFSWSIFLEGKDSDTIVGYGLDHLRQYMRLFPTNPLARLLGGYFLYTGTPLEVHGDEEDDKHSQQVVEERDPIDITMEAFGLLPDSLLGNRIVTEVFLQELDYSSVINVAENGLELVRRHEQNTGRKIHQVRKAFNVGLASALVHLHPPKHHPRALRLVAEVLKFDPNNVDALIGRGYVLQYTGKWEEAEGLFTKATLLVPPGTQKSVRAKEESAWCLSKIQIGKGVEALKEVLNDLQGDEHEMDRARCLWRIGQCCWEMGVDFREEAFSHFIDSLKCDRTYAPAYTSLGIYYSEFAHPPDPTRASRCFQKAFELDPREAGAAKRLAEGFADEREWDLVEVVARRTIDGEGGLDAGILTQDGAVVGRYLPTNAWAWKAVGVVEMMHRNYAQSIEAFQIALRAEPEDQLLWLRLGEAYSKAGRHAAALKALAKAHELDSDDWICTFLIGEVQHQTGRLVEALLSFNLILDARPKEIGVLLSLAQTQLDLAHQERSTGFSARSEQSFVAAITTCFTTSQESPGHGGVTWKVVADALFGLSKAAVFMDERSVRDILRRTNSLLQGRPSTRIAPVFSPQSTTKLTPLTRRHVLEAAVAAYDYRITVGSTEDIALGSALFDLAMALYAWCAEDKSNAYGAASESAISLLKQALQKEPGNPVYWTALGNMYFLGKPNAAQHAYIKALEHDSKSVMTWANLGLLYLYHNDLELANEALQRAQILDPDYTLAWVGQAMVAATNGHNGDARGLLEHAVGLSADVPLADLEFASRVFAALSATMRSQGGVKEVLLPAFFVLNRYAQRCPQDPCALHLLGLLCERLDQLGEGTQWISRAITLLEATYEESEDPHVERQFTIAHSNLARLKLGLGDHTSALDSFETALGLLPEEGPDNDTETTILRVQALFGTGLAQFKLGDLQSAMATFQSALNSSGEDYLLRAHVTVLLAQCMWAIGTEEFKESAKALLLDSIAADPESLMAINTLAGMGILTEDESLVDAALSEIQSLSVERRQELDPRRDVAYLLIQHHLSQGDVEQATRIAQKALHAEPSNVQLRRELASLILQQGNFRMTQAILEIHSSEENITEMKETLPLLAIAGKGKEAFRCAQKAILLDPGKLQNWQTLAYVRAREMS